MHSSHAYFLSNTNRRLTSSRRHFMTFRFQLTHGSFTLMPRGPTAAALSYFIEPCSDRHIVATLISVNDVIIDFYFTQGFSLHLKKSYPQGFRFTKEVLFINKGFAFPFQAPFASQLLSRLNKTQGFSSPRKFSPVSPSPVSKWGA